jgi:N utilization substance protein B
MGRRQAREMALKILYCQEEKGGAMEEIMDEIADRKKISAQDRAFSQKLAEKTLAHLPEIDRVIVKVLKNWQYERLSLIDKILLRIGTCEIMYFSDIPFQVTINEAIEVGKKYGGDDSGKFINGILDAIATEQNKGREEK